MQTLELSAEQAYRLGMQHGKAMTLQEDCVFCLAARGSLRRQNRRYRNLRAACFVQAVLIVALLMPWYAKAWQWFIGALGI